MYVIVWLFIAVPSAPEDIKAVPLSRDSILVSWLPPVWPNGNLISYTLYTQSDRVRKTTRME